MPVTIVVGTLDSRFGRAMRGPVMTTSCLGWLLELVQRETVPEMTKIVTRTFGVVGVAWCACLLFCLSAHADQSSSSPSSVWQLWYGPDGYGNGEGCYVPENNKVTRYGLVQSVIHRKTHCAGKVLPYATAQMSWKSFSFTYGVIRYRAKFAGGKGTWPAIWLLGAKCQPYGSGPDCHWPKEGAAEIDLSELKINRHRKPGQPYQQVWQNVFNQRTGEVLTCIPDIADATKNYHDYEFIWSPTSLEWFVDGVRTCRTSSPDHIPTTPMFVLIDVYLGREDGGGPIDPTTFPTRNNFRYLRVCPVGTAVCDAAHATVFDDEFRPGVEARWK